MARDTRGSSRQLRKKRTLVSCARQLAESAGSSHYQKPQFNLSDVPLVEWPEHYNVWKINIIITIVSESDYDHFHRTQLRVRQLRAKSMFEA